MKKPELPWPYFRGIWAGLWTGFIGGSLYGHDLLTNSPLARSMWLVIPGVCAFIAVLPDAVARIAVGIRRFRSVSAQPGEM